MNNASRNLISPQHPDAGMEPKMKKIYVAATQQHDGKTTISIGLYMAARERGLSACFIKPVGQNYLLVDGVKVDEDAVLFKDALSADGDIAKLSPVTIPRGFTEKYIFNRHPGKIRASIREAFDSVSADKDVAIIEGTGHAGVGSVIDASNAEVAHMLGAQCLMVAGGGIGRCIDELALNRALFKEQGVPMIGAVINKVYKEKYAKINRAVRQGLENVGISCLGVIPYVKELTFPTVEQIRDQLKLDVLSGEQYLDNRAKQILVGAMEPQNMVTYIRDGSFVVLPGDRVDNIVISINAHLMGERSATPRLAGILLTGGLTPDDNIVELLRQVDVPVLQTGADTATSAYRVRKLVAKILPTDQGKLSLAGRLIQDHVDLDAAFVKDD
jgi:hypothetical protein